MLARRGFFRSGLCPILVAVAAITLALPARAASPDAFPTQVARLFEQRFFDQPQLWQQGNVKPLFGALGKYIATASAAKPWGPRGRQAYRVDIPLMSSMDPIRYRRVFAVPGGVDLRAIRAAGVKLVLTVRNSPFNIDLPLPADGSADAAFQAALTALIKQFHPDYLVYGNEVDTRAKYRGTVAQFRHLMRLGHEVAAAKGVLDGGAALMGTMVAQATYADIRATQGKEAAGAFGDAAGMGAFHASLARRTNAYIDACRAAGVDYFVWHSYFSNPRTVMRIKTYVEKRFGAPSFINELGWRTGSARTGKAILNALALSGMPIVLVYGSGFGPNAPDRLWGTDGSLTPEGRILAAFLSGLGP